VPHPGVIPGSTQGCARARSQRPPRDAARCAVTTASEVHREGATNAEHDVRNAGDAAGGILGSWLCAGFTMTRSQSGVIPLLDHCAAGIRRHDDADPDPVASEASIRRFAEVVATTLVAEFRIQLTGLSPGDEPRMSFSVESLLDGRVVDEWMLREIASQLRLPTAGPFVVVAAEVSSMGSEALPGIEPKLRSLDAYSAWELLPELHVGIVHIHSEPHLDRVLALVSRLAEAPVGVSALYDDLRDTPQALHFAKVMLHSQSRRTSSVALFDGSLLAAAATSAPAVMVKSARAVLNGLADLPDEEQDILFETFRVWQDHDASADSAAKTLFCHPNTVRQRLRRIEKHSCRSLSRPRDVAELCLALEVHRMLIRPKAANC
jgi:PucR C-terminal helix-turn-helix domain/GGDEF-like domain